MTIEHTDDADALGAEALPGGLAEIRRALQPAPASDTAEIPFTERRGASQSSLLGRRKRFPDIVE